MILRLIQSAVRPTDPRRAHQVDEDIDAELSFHLENLERDLLAAGSGGQDARREALARFGDPELIRRRCRTIALKEDIMKQRIYLAIIAVLTLALVVSVTYATVLSRQRLQELHAMRAVMESERASREQALHAAEEARRKAEAAAAEQASQIFIDGAVARPGVYMFTRDLTLRRLIAAAGGLNADAIVATIDRRNSSPEVASRPDAGIRQLRLRYTAAQLADPAYTVDETLEPGDSIRIIKDPAAASPD